MDLFAKLSSEERKPYFLAAASRFGNLSPEVIQKDFWVCWTLKHLFALDSIGPHLTFKGGTSLSKVYGLIKRFSEDIDISIERDFLGFGNDMEPEAAKSKKEMNRRLENLNSACRKTVADVMLPKLFGKFKSILGTNNWSLIVAPEDPDQQTLTFIFPDAFDSSKDSYLKPVVKIELGARSDHWPVENKNMTAYLSDVISDVFQQPKITVKVLRAVRTFWEKATILHSIANYPGDKKTPARYSRHYYDFFRLLGSSIKEEAISDLSLLDRVVQHKSIFFRSGWARYEEAKPGSLKLVPSASRQGDLIADYIQMQPMFFEEPPSFDKILEEIASFEKFFNSVR